MQTSKGRFSTFSFWVLLILGALGVSGCATLHKGKNPHTDAEKEQQILALKQQNQDQLQRVDSLGKDNAEQQKIVAQTEQAKKQAEEKTEELLRKTRELNSEIEKLKGELAAKEQTVQSLNASFQRQESVSITPTHSVLKHTPVLTMEGVSVLPRTGENGDTIRIAINDQVLFHPGTTQLLPNADTVLTAVLNEIRVNYPDNRIGIEGHTDPVLDNPQNPTQAIELSSRKANAVAEHLLDRKQISPNRLRVSGFGASRPISDGKTAEARNRNNRVEMVVYP